MAAAGPGAAGPGLPSAGGGRAPEPKGSRSRRGPGAEGVPEPKGPRSRRGPGPPRGCCRLGRSRGAESGVPSVPARDGTGQGEGPLGAVMAGQPGEGRGETSQHLPVSEGATGNPERDSSSGTAVRELGGMGTN
ncbi:collagen alpha-1(I) chain-like [Poecile atricapillus]|uniref:collagen alpha-1(I) chain-like n=1 Tax=Poecile atricapillus TaxID=48891 RepID=UPI00273A57AB|nr:collagen alpha-1(I) chain-like [Poecile atricapillus]